MGKSTGALGVLGLVAVEEEVDEDGEVVLMRMDLVVRGLSARGAGGVVGVIDMVGMALSVQA